jgi:hypothetical protein
MNKKIKKLTLSVETVKSLDERDLEQAAGGISTGCPTFSTARCTECTRGCSFCEPCIE